MSLITLTMLATSAVMVPMSLVYFVRKAPWALGSFLFFLCLLGWLSLLPISSLIARHWNHDFTLNAALIAIISTVILHVLATGSSLLFSAR